jgi:hypothetical protein
MCKNFENESRNGQSTVNFICASALNYHELEAPLEGTKNKYD